MDLIMGIISAIRNIRGEMNISPSLFLTVSVLASDESTGETIRRHQDLITNLARVKSFSVEKTGKRPKSAATAVVNGATIFVFLEGIVDFRQEIKRLEKEINKLDVDLSVTAKKLQNEEFLNKAPKQVVEKVKERRESLAEKMGKLQSNLEKVREVEA
jgi:valyl-tRNA synthetase